MGKRQAGEAKLLALFSYHNCDHLRSSFKRDPVQLPLGTWLLWQAAGSPK